MQTLGDHRFRGAESRVTGVMTAITLSVNGLTRRMQETGLIRGRLRFHQQSEASEP